MRSGVWLSWPQEIALLIVIMAVVIPLMWKPWRAACREARATSNAVRKHRSKS